MSHTAYSLKHHYIGELHLLILDLLYLTILKLKLLLLLSMHRFVLLANVAKILGVNIGVIQVEITIYVFMDEVDSISNSTKVSGKEDIYRYAWLNLKKSC